MHMCCAHIQMCFGQSPNAYACAQDWPKHIEVQIMASFTNYEKLMASI